MIGRTEVLPGRCPVAAEALEAGLAGHVAPAHVLQPHVVQPRRQARPGPVTHEADKPLQVTQVLPKHNRFDVRVSDPDSGVAWFWIWIRGLNNK